MIRLKANNVSLFTLLALFCFLFTSVVLATAETISVPANQTVIRSIDLNAEDEVSGRIAVVGNEESADVNFTIIGPRDLVVSPTIKVTVTDFKFSASEKGTYRFLFDNSLSAVDKTVSLNYDVTHYWFGLPQEVVLMLIVVFVGVLALVVYALISRG